MYCTIAIRSLRKCLLSLLCCHSLLRNPAVSTEISRLGFQSACRDAFLQQTLFEGFQILRIFLFPLISIPHARSCQHKQIGADEVEQIYHVLLLFYRIALLLYRCCFCSLLCILCPRSLRLCFIYLLIGFGCSSLLCIKGFCGFFFAAFSADCACAASDSADCACCAALVSVE